MTNLTVLINESYIFGANTLSLACRPHVPLFDFLSRVMKHGSVHAGFPFLSWTIFPLPTYFWFEFQETLKLIIKCRTPLLGLLVFFNTNSFLIFFSYHYVIYSVISFSRILVDCMWMSFILIKFLFLFLFLYQWQNCSTDTAGSGATHWLANTPLVYTKLVPLRFFLSKIYSIKQISL